MLITIPDVLTAGEVAQARAALDAAEWVDGKVTAGYQAQKREGQSSTAGGASGGSEARRDGIGSISPFAAVHVGCASAASVSADVQPIHRRRALRHACRYGDSDECDDGTTDPDRCFGDIVSLGSGRI